MCLAKAYLKGDGDGELVLEDVAFLEVEGKTVRLSTIFGEQKEMEAVIRQVDFNSSQIILAKTS
ncbi:MAG: CooT family nickel-binding protein [Dehalococcoidia bacterium]|nr:CooT family nickel-binding protein [Dehalococcoidia bacterium]